MIRSSISGISSSNSACTKSGWQRRQHDLHAMALLADLQDDGLDALADVVRFAGNLLAARQKSLALAERNDGGAGVHAGDGADHEFALLAGELVEYRVRFGLANLLDNHLLGRLRGDAAERFGVEFVLAVAGDDVAGGLVDLNEDAFLDAEVPLGGHLDGGRDAVEDGLLGNLAFFVQRLDELEDRFPRILLLFLLFLDRHVHHLLRCNRSPGRYADLR